MAEFAAYQINPGHEFENLTFIWWFFVRAECACGWKTRLCLSVDVAANLLIVHQSMTGTRIA